MSAAQVIEDLEAAAAAFYSMRGAAGPLDRVMTRLDKLDRMGDPVAVAYTSNLLANLEAIRVRCQAEQKAQAWNQKHSDWLQEQAR